MYSVLTQINLFLALLLSVASANATPTPEKSWSINWYNKYQFSLHTSDDPDKRASMNSTLEANFLPTPTLRIQGVVGGIQAIKPALDFRVINPEFRGFFLLSAKENKLKITIGPTLVLPFGSDAKEESLIFGAGVGSRMVLNLKSEDGSGFRSYYDLTCNKNFHQYETSILSEVNNQLALNHTVYLEYKFDSQWDLNAAISFSSLWNYRGVLSNNYSIEQELDFQATEITTFYLSHSRGGDFLSPNGQSYSFGIFNRDSSRMSLGVVFGF